MSKGSAELERLFVELNDEVFGYEEDWFGSGLSHSIFTPALTMWLMMLQAIHKASLGGALRLLEEGAADLLLSRNAQSKKAKTRNISNSTGGYSQARKRLELSAVQDLVEAINERLICKKRKSDTYVMDGSILTLYKSKDIEIFYPPHKNNRGASLPQMRIVFAADADSGVCALPSFAAETVSEQKLCLDVMERIPRGATLIADANFGIFHVAYNAASLGLTPIFRLTELRAKSLLKQTRLPEEGEFEIEWTPSKSELQKYPELKEAKGVKGKIVLTTIKHKGYKPILIPIFTTSNLPKKEIVEKYKERHKIEIDIRQLKITLETDFLSARTKDMVEKELLIRIAAHNLLRDIIKEATLAIGLEPRQVSFTRAIDYIKIFGPRMQSASSDNERIEMWNRFLTIIRQLKHPNRKKQRPTYPREVRRNSRRFPLKHD